MSGRHSWIFIHSLADGIGSSSTKMYVFHYKIAPIPYAEVVECLTLGSD
jgi:hypothetical protein